MYEKNKENYTLAILVKGAKYEVRANIAAICICEKINRLRSIQSSLAWDEKNCRT
jgi:hypothetical protein